MYNIMFSQSKPRRTKTPIASVRDKFEEVHRPSQSEMPPVIRSEPEPSPEPIVETAPVKAKKSNAWIGFVKAHAESNNLKFRDALRDPALKENYKKFKENKV
jgi:hypothetical protein